MRDSYLVGLNGVGFLIVVVVEGCRKGSRHASQVGENGECCELHTDEKVLRRCWDARVDEDSDLDRPSFYTIIDSENFEVFQKLGGMKQLCAICDSCKRN